MLILQLNRLCLVLLASVSGLFSLSLWMYPLYFHLILEWLFSCCRVPCWQQFSIRILKLLLAGCCWEGCCQPRCHFREGICLPSPSVLCNPTSVSLSTHHVSLCLAKSVSFIQVLHAFLGMACLHPDTDSRWWDFLTVLPPPGSELPFLRVTHHLVLWTICQPTKSFH